MTVNQKINSAVSDLVKGKAWPNTYPKEEEPNEYIVYYPLEEVPSDYGDDSDLTWVHFMAVHWIKKGNVNYTKIRNDLRSRLEGAGFNVTQIVPGYDHDSKTTHVIVNCNIIEEDFDGTS